MHDGLFCYGTLQHPEVFRRITGMTPRYEPAQLAGYARYRVRNADYPGVVRAPGGIVDGLVCRGVSRAQWQRLDSFEGEYYQRCLLTVTLRDAADQLAWVYVIRDYCRGLLTHDAWSINEHQQHFLKRLQTHRL